MSTSLLYHVFGLRGHRYRHIRFEKGQVRFTVELKRKHLRCSVCQCRRVVRRGTLERRVRCPPIGNKPV